MKKRVTLNSEYLSEASEYELSSASATDEEASHGTGGSSSGRGAPLEAPAIAAEENKHVFYSRILLIFVVLLSVVLLVYLTFRIASDAEKDAFESQVRKKLTKKIWFSIEGH